MSTDRIVLCEIKIINKNVRCVCGRGNMVGTSAVRLAGNKYEHQHRCIFFDSGFDKIGCGAEEWFSHKYPLREEREFPITPE